MKIEEEMMLSKIATYKEGSLFPIMNAQILRKVVSDVSSEIDQIGKDINRVAQRITHDVIVGVECYCCGLREECTQDYILRVKDSHSDKWVCGLCSEAVKEGSKRAATPLALPPPAAAAIEEALRNHKRFCVEFNSTTRLNPKLSFTSSLREIAKRSNLNRANKDNDKPPFSKMGRSSSCLPELA